MKKNLVQKLLAASLSMAMVLSLAACGSTDDGKKEESKVEESKVEESKAEESVEDAEPTWDEVTELPCYISFGSGNSDDAPWFDQWMAEEIGVVLRGRRNDDATIMSALLASGELPDIVGFNNANDPVVAIEGGMLLDLNEYRDQLPNLFEDEEMMAALQYRMDNLSGGTGGCYTIPINVGANPSANATPAIRWDLYKAAGYPECNTVDEFLEALKEMQDIARANGEDNVWALTSFTDWDGFTAYAVEHGYGSLMRYNFYSLPLCVMMQDGSAEPVSVLEDGSGYHEALKFYFKANQMGILDPDMPAMKYNDAITKYANGSAIFIPAYIDTSLNRLNDNENAADWKGYAEYIPECYSTPGNYDSPVGHMNWSLGISADCENLDAALRFINWWASDEFASVYHSGPEGVLWERKDDGSIVKTELALTGDGVFPGGGTLGDMNQVLWCAPKTGYALDKNGDTYSVWQNPAYVGDELYHSALMDDWYSVNGEYSSLRQKARTEGLDTWYQPHPFIAFLPAITPEINEMAANIGSIVKENSYKMIYAENEEEFNALWEQTQAEAEALGIDQVVENGIERYRAAMELVTKYMQ